MPDKPLTAKERAAQEKAKREAALRKKIGTVTSWTDSEMGALSEVDGIDIAHAIEAWHTLAPDGWQGLLDAKRVG